MSIAVSPKPEKLSARRMAQMISSIIGGGARPSDDDPSPPGPWGPVIRSMFAIAPGFSAAADARASAFERFGIAALNPQPLPPRIGYVVALGHAAVVRAELLGEFAGQGVAKLEAGSSRSARRYLSELLDDWCGTPPRPIPWPWPRPRPEWAREALGALDHLVLASAFEQMAATGVGGELADGLKAERKHLLEAATESLSL